ncbi:MAG: glycosyltransferase [candidate division Zixibacteria bacterium]|nr:glycosyltransferase [candidate division Zixibacteria bacterium]
MSSYLLKILLFADSRSFHTERFAGELRKQGCYVLVASVERGRMLHFHLREHGEVHTVHYLLSIPRARALLKRFQPDIVVAHFASGYGFLTSLLGQRPHIPYLLHVLGSDVLIVPNKSFLRRKKVQRALRMADCVVADSEYLASETAILESHNRIEMIGWGVEKKALEYHKPNYKLTKPLRIIVPRGHESVYNNNFIIDSIATLLEDGQVEITFPNSGSLLPEFRKLASTISKDRIHYYDRMHRKEFVPFMASFDVCLSAAVSDSSPTILIEAMALGLIPIAADIPGVREWLNSDSGYLFDLNDSSSLQVVINEIVKRADSHENMRHRNLEEVRQRGIFEDNMRLHIELMRQLVSEARA